MALLRASPLFRPEEEKFIPSIRSGEVWRRKLPQRGNPKLLFLFFLQYFETKHNFLLAYLSTP